MKILILLILSILFYPPFTTQNETEVNNQIICTIAGRFWRSTYVFDISQLPNRCGPILVGSYKFNRRDLINTHVMESDKGIIRSLVKANIPVYTYVGLLYKDEDWPTILEPTDEDIFQKQIFDPLVNFLNDFKISGIILDVRYLYTFTIDDLENKISGFVTNIKAKVNNLKVGMIISGLYYSYFSNNSLFDFTITNKVLDLYMIDLGYLNSCDNDSLNTGVSPITSPNPAVITYELVTSFVNNSSMDTSKIFAIIQTFATMPYSVISEALYTVTSYSMYCSSTDTANSSQWCINPSQLSYDQAVYAKKFYAGIVLDQLDTDDYDGKCGCKNFPVSNIILDGWTASPLKTCPKLDHK